MFNFIRTVTKKKDVYSGEEKSVKESKESDNLIVAEQNYSVSMISEFLGKLIMVTGHTGK
jgi:hypothetical protein